MSELIIMPNASRDIVTFCPTATGFTIRIGEGFEPDEAALLFLREVFRLMGQELPDNLKP